jgi:hypothetical protein
VQKLNKNFKTRTYISKNKLFTHIYENRSVISGDLHLMHNDGGKII